MFSRMFNMNGTQDEMVPRIKEGRAYWNRKTVFISRDDINDGYYGNYWKNVEPHNHYIRGYGNTYNISKHIAKWEAQLTKGIPTFAGTGLTAICSIVYVMVLVILKQIMSEYWYSRPKWMHHNEKYVHDVDDNH